MHKKYISFAYDDKPISTVNLSCTDDLTYIRNSKMLSHIDAASISIIGEFDSLPEGLFQDCKALSIYLDDRISNIESFCFNNCRNLQYVHIPCNISIINNSVFENCSSLSTIDIPYTVEQVENNAFDGCISLLSIDLSFVKSIGNSCFSICSNLVNVVTNSCLKHIGYQAFQKCYSLSNINIESAIIAYEAFVDSSMSTMHNIYDDLLSTEQDRQQYIMKIVLDDNKCNAEKYLKHITISFDNGYIPYAAFEHRHDISSISINNDISAINDYAFHRCVNLQQVKLPTKLEYIGKYAFSSCYSLKEILFPNTLFNIDKCAFAKCFNIKNLVFPYMLKRIGQSAFEYCFSLNSIQFNGNTKINVNAFNNCQMLNNIIAYNKLILEEYAFPYCFSLQTIDQKKHQYFITYDNSFYCCKSLDKRSFKHLNKNTIKLL